MQETKYLKRAKYKYLGHDKYVIYNENDQDLHPIVLRLPDPPDLHLIDGYGEEPNSQIFKRHETPEGLLLLEERALKTLEQSKANKNDSVTGYKLLKKFWELLEEEKHSFEEEIEYIKKVHWHCFYGYWFFCKGKPTYITPWHYYYLNFCHFPDSPYRPYYRDTDRRTEVFEWYCYTTTESFNEVDEKGEAIKVDGKYTMRDFGHRTIYGTIKPKRRREGASFKGCMRVKWIAEHHIGVRCTITADTGNSARDIFLENLIPTFQKEPLFLKPVFSGTFSPKRRIDYETPANVARELSLRSTINWTETAGEGGNDRRKLFGWLDDESAKVVTASALERFERTKPTLSQGLNIHGYCNQYSTVEEMEEGGATFEEMCRQSDFYVRNPDTGFTQLGTALIFVPAYDGRDGFIDYWGYSVIEDPTEEQIEYAEKDERKFDHNYVELKKGAKRFLEEEYDRYKIEGTPEAQAKYRLIVRKDPINFADCWLGTSGDVGFDNIILDKRIAEVKRKPITDRIDFKWEGNKVVWNRNPNGYFNASNLFLNEGIDNLWTYMPGKQFDKLDGQMKQQRRPLFPSRFTAGADPFDFSTKSEMQQREGAKTRVSYGGGFVLQEYDSTIDSSADMSEWETRISVCTYKKRPPTLNEYCEHMLMMCVYYGAMLVPERNKPYISTYFINRGFGGYLKYMRKPDGTYHPEPGIWLGAGSVINDMINELRDYVSYRGHKEPDLDFLQDLRRFKGREDLTNRDLTTAAGLALLGSRSTYGKEIERIHKTVIDISGTRLARRRY